MKLENKVALITGGTGGQGSAEARLFASEGAAVVIADIADDSGKALANELTSAGYKACYIHLDVSSEEDWDKAVETVKETFGALHVLVNNAGINGGKPLAFEDLDSWNSIFAVNVTGPMLGIRKFCRLMRDSGGGAIVNIGSTVGTNGHFLPAYSSSKWALRGLSKSAAFTLSEWGIRSNMVCPGVIDTPIWEHANPDMLDRFAKANVIQRMGTPEEVANAVLFLACDDSSFITGQEISVDGGFDATAAYGQGVLLKSDLKNMMSQD